MVSKKQTLVLVCLFSLAAALLAVSGTLLALRAGVFPGVAGASANGARLDELARVISERFVAPVDDETLLVNAQKGMVAGLGDKYSAFYTSEEFAQLSEQRSGQYQGIGVLLALRQDDGALEIFEVYPDTPADKAGLAPHDILLAINEQDTAGLGVDDAAALVRAGGEKGVKLKVSRRGVAMEFTVWTDKVVIPQVEWRMISNDGQNIGYIHIKQFMGDVVNGFTQALSELKEQNMQALIIDLRNNPGGDLNMVVEVCDKVLPAGVIVTERSRSGEERVFSSNAEWVELPMAVLVNGYSASASEIMAGAIQDYDVGKLVGTSTYGKGVVQSVIPLRSGDYVKLTTAMYFTPKGRNVQGVGLKPDFETDIPEELKSTPMSEWSEAQDTQLQAALLLLKK